MAKKKSRKYRAGTSTKKSSQRIINVKLLSKIFIICICLLATYFLFLDYRIHKEFEGSKWTLPARVYSRPIDIYVGQAVSPGFLDQVLQAQNYQLSRNLSGPGTYSRSDDRINVHLRAFDYWDGHSQAIPYGIEFQNGAISRIINMNSDKPTTLIRVEPGLIGKIYPDHNEDRVLISLEEVPPFLIDALIAVEDRGFYRHFGIDFRAIVRAFWVNLRSGELAQGGSTLTQQLVKNFFLTHERTFSRKINEVIMALLLEWRYEKQEILSAYINEVYLGQDGSRAIHGFGTAAEFYFNKPLTELRRDQLALLVGLVRGASFYNPRRSPDRAEARRNLVLKLMVEQGYLDEQTRILLDKNSLGVSKTGGRPDSGFQSFLDLARRQLLRDYELDDLKNEGLKIYTTLDTLQQQGLNDIVERRLNSLEKQHDLKAGSLEAATVIINPVNGEVLALSGGRNSTHSGFNRALDAYRPIGSLIKPFIYLTALSSGKYSLLSDLLDRRVSLDQKDGLPWTPDNYDKFEHGEISLLEAIVHSYNLATVRLGLEVGLDNIITTLHKAGVNGAINPYPSLLLGAQELSPFEVTQIYQTLANGGYRAPLNSIREVLDNQGEPLQHRSLTIDKTLEEGPVFLVNYVLHKVVEIGTARQLSNYLGPDSGLAGKTGTTNESRDSWYAGFSDDILAVTWLGRDDNEPTPFTGASGAMLIWADVLKSASYIPLNLVTPQDIAWTDDMGLYFGDECVQLGPVPYIGTIAPESALDCSRKQLIFDIRSWFQ